MSQAETEELTRIIIVGAALSRAVSSVAEIGIADLIESGTPRSAEDLARETGAHERSLYRIMRFLASHGIFREAAVGEFEHTRLSECLRDDAVGSFRAAARMMHRAFPAWEGLHHSLLTGEPGFNKVYGQHIFEYAATHPDLGPIFDAGMTAIHGYETGAMLEAYDFGGTGVLADIGGGNGSLITAVLKKYPAMRGILFDLGHVVERSRKNLQIGGVDDRCDVIEGSFFDTIPVGADAYLFRHIIHDWTDEQCAQILGHARKVMPEDGKLLLVECVIESGNEPSIAKDFDITMMTLPGGIERTADEFRALLDASGFEMTSITPTNTMVSVVEGRPA